MLFLLSSEVQSGKTRWLQQLVARLQAEGVTCAGVLAPGVWRELSDEEFAQASAANAASASRFEKLGIDNVLLPSGERVAFGRRTDLAQAEGACDAASQSNRAQLGWTIFDDAIDRVNEHFAQLALVAQAGGAPSSAPDAVSPAVPAPDEVPPALLVVDEMGRLELQHDGGLVEAARLLRKGPSAAFPHTLVVVRSWLADLAEEAFCPAWGPALRVEPTDAGLQTVLETVL